MPYENHRALSFAFCCAALAACAQPMAVESTPVAAEDLCGQLATALCDADATCCQSHSGTCADDQRAACEAALQPLIDDPRLGYDPDLGGQFLDTIRMRAQQCWQDPPDYDALVSAFAGTGAEGADCTPASLNESDLRVSALSCSDGTACRLYLRADGSYEGECAARTDDSCSHPLDCGAGEFCSLPGDWQPGMWGTCRPLRANGWECGGDLECESRHCDGTCQPMPEARRCLQTRYTDLILSDTPLAYLQLDGAVASDASGNGNTVSVEGSVTSDAHGAIGGSPSHTADGGTNGTADGGTNGTADGGTNGTADGGLGGTADGGVPSTGSLTTQDEAARLGGDGYLRIAAMSSLADASGLSLECWFRADSTDNPAPILEFSDGTQYGPQVWQYDTGDKLFANLIDDNGDGHTMMTDSGTVTSGEWHHVVVSYDGTGASLYLDGHRVGHTAVSTALRVDGDLYIGHRPTDTELPAYFIGSVDQVAVYDHALGGAAVTRHHDAGTNGLLDNTFPLFRWLSAR